MTKRNVYNVTPAGSGDWEVKKKGAARAVKVFEGKANAIARAKVLAQKGALGQVIIRKQDGKIQTEYTYGKDPRETKG